jgi:hypothetical protein
MFALKIPLTGFFVGGFAVVLIALIAWYSNRSYRQVIQATILVMLVKALVSPHAPLPAYVAVAFQGFAGAFLFSTIKNFRLSAVLLGILGMAESALQKLLLLTLLFGKSLWEAVNEFFQAIVKDFSLPAHLSFSAMVIIIYVSIYVVWGLLIGLWMGKLPTQIAMHATGITTAYRRLPVAAKDDRQVAQKKKNKYWLLPLLLAFIVAVALMDSRAQGWQKALYVLVRSIAATLLLFGLVQPAGKWLLQRWLKKQNNERHAAAQKIADSLPELKTYLKPAWQLAGAHYSGLKRMRAFVFNLIVLTLHANR